MSADQADDLLQGFVLKKVLQRQLVARADRSRGKFRTFLLTALDRYVLDELERKQIPEVAYEEGTSDPQVAPADAYEQTWVRIVLDEVIGRMRAECEAEGQAEIWGVFECRLLTPALDQVEPPAYREIVQRLGFQSPIQAANALTTAKRKFRRILELVIAEYAADGQVDEEIAELRRILTRPVAATK
jgi:RNA polymerase sigma-70 factor (ECF subfamily)